MSIFENLDKEFDIEELEFKAKTDIKNTSDTLAEVSVGISNQKYTIEDQRYLKVELQELINSDKEVLAALKDQVLTPGAPAAIAGIYATLSKSMRENLAQFAELEKQLTDYQVIESNEQFREKTLESKERLAERRLARAGGDNKVPGQITQNNTYIFDPKSQFEVIKNLPVSESSQEDLPKFDLS